MLALLDKRKNKQAANKLADAVQMAARKAVFYLDYAVPDTRQGRLDLLLLHLCIVSAGLARYEAKSKVAQKAFDLIFRNIQEGFRQIGVGDLSVPHKMKDSMRAANGLSDLLYKNKGNPELLKHVVLKNLYHNVPECDGHAALIAQYCDEQMDILAAEGPDDFTFASHIIKDEK